jgi:hypothetical protein
VRELTNPPPGRALRPALRLDEFYESLILEWGGLVDPLDAVAKKRNFAAAGGGGGGGGAGRQVKFRHIHTLLDYPDRMSKQHFCRALKGTKNDTGKDVRLNCRVCKSKCVTFCVSCPGGALPLCIGKLCPTSDDQTCFEFFHTVQR